MATINLRDYLKGIEELIDSGQVEDALAHSRHVLQSFPKNIDTYRLMGKAYLESKRHNEASDLFQRVLSSIPDDFVSHIGLSIIREDGEDLNAAIWHMERAFESQPSNRAVQDELRRLYGKREGYEPPKVRLTRGALARMYSHGDLYTQAIGELRGALAEDAQRPDLQALLAEMYFKTNQPTEAIQVCSQIIQKLPYCLNANRIMVDILRNSQRDIEANPYWERVEELDPYAAQVSALKDAELAPAESVTIEQLVLESPKALTPPKAWTSSLKLPTEEGYEKEELPNWLSLDNLEAPAAEATKPEAVPQEEQDSLLSNLQGLEPVPAAGEAEPAAAETQPEAEIDETPSPFHSVSRSTALQADQIPDWLRELRPMTGSLTPQPVAEPEPEAQPEAEPAQRWTDELKKAGFKPTGPLNLSDTNPQVAKSVPVPPQEVIGGLGTTELRWLDSDLGDEPAGPAGEPAATPASPSEPELPNWLHELNQEDQITRKPTSPLSETLPIAPDELITSEPEPVPSPPIEQAPPQSAAAEQSGSPTWLDELKADSGMTDEPEIEEAAPAVEDHAGSRLDDLAKWETQPAEMSPSEQQPELSKEDEENLSWLEGLAAKQGAAEEELLTTPEERKLAKPEWLQASQVDPQAQPAKSEALSWLDELAAAGGQVASATGDVQAGEIDEPLEDFDDLLEPAHEGETPIEHVESMASGDEPVETTPAWLRQLSAEMEGGSAPAAAEPIAPRPLEEAPDWLKDLSPANAAGLKEAAEQRAEAEPAHLSTPEDLGSADWLDSEAEEEGVPTPAVEPTWLPASQAHAAVDDQPEATFEPELAEDETESLPQAAIEPEIEPAEPEQMEAEPERMPEPVVAAQPEGGQPQRSLRRRTTLLDPEQVEDRLAQARQALSYGNINDAVEAYGYMLRRRIRLDEVIADLRAALRRFPRQVALWQALGDAYMRNNQLKDALECYTKAETLL